MSAESVDMDDLIQDKSELSGSSLESKKQQYLEIMEQLNSSGQEEVSAAFGELLDSLHQSKESESQLQSKVSGMQNQINQLTDHLEDVTAYAENLNAKARESNEEIEYLKKRVDMGQLREQDNLELIDSLRSQTESLETEVDRVKKEQADLAVELGISGRTKEAFFKEREKLKTENAALKENLGTLEEENSNVTQELEQTKSSLILTQQELDNLKLQTKELERDKGYMSKEASLQRSLVHQLKKNLILLKTHHDALKLKLNSAEANIQDQKVGLFSMENTNKKLRTAINNDQTEISNLNKKIYDLTQDNKDTKIKALDKEKEILNWKKKVNEAENKNKKVSQALNSLKTKAARAIDENKKNKLVSGVSNTSERSGEVSELQNELLQLKRKYVIVGANLLKTSHLMVDYLKKYEVENSVRKSMEIEREKIKHDMHQYFMTNIGLLDERDRCKADKKLIEMKLEEQILYVRHKEMVLGDIKKELEERKIEIRKQMSMVEELKGQRNVIAKSLAKTQDTNEDIKRHNRTLSKQLDQLKEMITIKDNQMIRIERANNRKGNETLKLKWQLSKSRNHVKECKEVTQKLEKEEVMRIRVLDRTQKQQAMAKRALSRAINEKAVLLTQLDRKVAELNCLEDNFNFMDIILKKGDRQYNQRLDDIRILRLEVLKLRREKAMVMKALENSADLRREVYHLYTELNTERIKSTALEQEIQTPVNYHRWRFLQGKDPERKDLIDKVNQLQQSLIKKRDEMSKMEKEIERLKSSHEEYRQQVERIPGIEVYETLAAVRHKLNLREEEIKTLSSLLTCAEHEVKKLKLNQNIYLESVNESKRKYYDMKLSYDKLKHKVDTEKSSQHPCEVMLPDNENPERKARQSLSSNASCIIINPIQCL